MYKFRMSSQGIFIYCDSFCQTSADRKSPKKYFSILSFCWRCRTFDDFTSLYFISLILLRKWKRSNIILHENNKQILKGQRSWVFKKRDKKNATKPNATRGNVYTIHTTQIHTNKYIEQRHEE